MKEIIKVKGMHCSSCVQLISMDLEDLGIESDRFEITLLSDNVGSIEISEIDDEIKEKIVNQINSYPNYKVE